MKDFKPEIQWVNPESLVPYAKNSKAHSIDQIDQIASSISSFGWHSPIVVNRDNVIISGHGRLEAAVKLGMQEVPIVKMDLDEYQAMAARILDNRSNESPWNLDFLRFDLGTLKNEGIDLKLTGFPEFQLGDFLETGFLSDETFEPRTLGTEFAEGKGKQGLTDPDEVPENVPAKSKLGDLYRLGNHRILCGDATRLQDVERLLDGQRMDMVFTDPPYGMNLNTDYSKMPRGGKKYSAVIGDDKPFDPNIVFSVEVDRYCVWGADWFYERMPSGFSPIVWDKQPHHIVAGPQNHFELCWVKPSEKRRIVRKLWTGFTAKEKHEDRTHPTQKPIEVCIDIMERGGSKVIDFFGGSGTTLIACEKTGRKCWMMEIDPHYIDVIIARWEGFSGQKAELI